MVLVTHHVEEIPLGISHALLLRDGKVVAQGLITDVLTSEYLSQTFGLALTVERDAGRFYARAVTPDGYRLGRLRRMTNSSASRSKARSAPSGSIGRRSTP